MNESTLKVVSRQEKLGDACLLASSHITRTDVDVYTPIRAKSKHIYINTPYNRKGSALGGMGCVELHIWNNSNTLV